MIRLILLISFVILSIIILINSQISAKKYMKTGNISKYPIIIQLVSVLLLIIYMILIILKRL